MNREPIKIIADVISDYMSLDAGRVYLFNQDYKIPKDDGIFIVLQHINSRPYSSTNTTKSIDGGGVEETSTILMREEYTINVMSKNRDAYTRKEEVILALRSYNSRELQETYQFKISPITGPFLNISGVEGSGMLNRFAANVVVLSWYSNTLEIPYYDTFNTELKSD